MVTVSSEAGEGEVVLAERRGRVLVLTLNRPDRLNTWTRTMQDRYFDALEAAEDDPDIGAIVVTGAGRNFCAGADMRALDRIGAGDPKARRVLDRPTYTPFFVRKPMVAAINGACAGIGFVQAMYCDVRFVARDAKLTTSYAQRGLTAEHGIAWILNQVVGFAVASDLLMSARVIRGDEAYALGIAHRVCDRETVVDEAVRYAAELTERCSPKAVAVIKEQLRAATSSSFIEAAELARRRMLESYTWPDMREGVASFRERRAPVFPPLPPRSEGGD